MANITKLLLPLIGDFLTLQDLDTSDKSGFVDAFIEDVNRPYLREKVFLMYRVNVPPSVMICRDYDFNNSGRLYDKRSITIDGTDYYLYTFTILEKDVLNIFKGLPPRKRENFLKIVKFWNFTDDFINEFTYDRHTPFEICNENTLIPEEDFIEAFPDEESLIIEKAPDIRKDVLGFTIFLYPPIHHIYR